MFACSPVTVCCTSIVVLSISFYLHYSLAQIVVYVLVLCNRQNKFLNTDSVQHSSNEITFAMSNLLYRISDLRYGGYWIDMVMF